MGNVIVRNVKKNKNEQDLLSVPFLPSKAIGIFTLSHQALVSSNWKRYETECERKGRPEMGTTDMALNYHTHATAYKSHIYDHAFL